MSYWKYRPGDANSRSLIAATTGPGKAISFKDYQRIHWLIEGSAGVGAGAVVIESSHDPNFAGTWHQIAAPVVVVANAVLGGYADFPPGAFVRARVTTTVTGGTVTVYLNGIAASARSGIVPLAPTAISGIRVSVAPEGLAGFADNATIDVWVNETGLGNDFIQATEANKPICKTNILNGFRIARFDGVDDRISSQYGPKDDLADGFTFAAVFRTTTTATRQIILWTGDSNTPGFPVSGFPTSTFSITDDGTANLVGNILFSPTTDDPKSYASLTDTTNFHIGICTFRGFGTNPGNKTVQMFLDGVFADAHTESFSEDYTQYVALTRMGTPGNLAANFFNGDIAAAAIFARALSQSEITGLHLFWKNKFNL